MSQKENWGRSCCAIRALAPLSYCLASTPKFATFVSLFCWILVCNLASACFVLGAPAVFDAFPAALSPCFFVFTGKVRFPALVVLFVASRRGARIGALQIRFEVVTFSFGLTAALIRLLELVRLLELNFAALPRVFLRADVIFCLGVAVAPFFFDDFLRAAIVIISTPELATTPH